MVNSVEQEEIELDERGLRVTVPPDDGVVRVWERSRREGERRWAST